MAVTVYRELNGVFTSGTALATDTFADFAGPGKLLFVGTTTLATLATGSNSGTAGAGTTTTSVVKPTGADDWTTNNCRNLALKLTGGGGAGDDPTHRPVFRNITSNTTTTLSVEAVAGMDETTTFQIVNRADVPDDILDISGCAAPIEIRGLLFDTAAQVNLLSVSECFKVTVDGCDFADNATDYSCRIQDCEYVTFSNNTIRADASVLITGCRTVTNPNTWMNAGATFSVTECSKLDTTKFRALSATGTAYDIRNCELVKAEVKADSCAVTPVYLESLKRFVAQGSLLLTGTNGTPTYGIQIEDPNGPHGLTGSDLAGTYAGILFENNPVTWANLNSAGYGIAESYAGNAYANAGFSKSIKFGAYNFQGQVEVVGRALYYGYRHDSVKLTHETATGTVAGDSYDLSSNNCVGGVIFGTVAAGTGARLPSNAAIPGSFTTIVNLGANSLTVYPPSGGLVNGGASVTIAANKMRLFVSLTTTNGSGTGGKDFWATGDL